VRVLFDHNIPRKLRRLLKGHYVSIALEMNWTTLRNGDLLRAAEDAGSDVMVTADQDLSYQQNLSGRKLALVVLNTNNWNVIQQHSERIIASVDAATPGSFQTVLIAWFTPGR
jgi:predicted nuclease of predicted toxin-antitoxin system